MEPSVGSVMIIFVGAPLVLAAVVTLLVLLFSPQSRSSSSREAPSGRQEGATDVAESSQADAEDPGPDSGGTH